MYILLILPMIFITSLVINYLEFSIKKSSIEIVNDMGIGYNLGNSYDCYNISKDIQNPDEQITLFGNPVPTKKLIKRIKQYGFKTIRLPVTWINFIDENGKANIEWMERIKEVVGWINDNNLYCILNIQKDGLGGNWLSNGIRAKEKYVKLWAQIAEEFKDFNEYLIFESMNNVGYYTRSFFEYLFDYEMYYNFTQAFVDTIRNSGGNNNERLLIISGPSSDLELTSSQAFKLPIDPYNKLAVSIDYYIPSYFTSIPYSDYWLYSKDWGNDANYNELITNIENMKTVLIDKGIPVILSEIGVMTEENKDIVSIREYLYAVFSISSEYDGIMPCLWDTSNRDFGDMNYYNRETNKWYDEKIKENFIEISKGKFIKSSDFYTMTNRLTITTPDNYGDFIIKLPNIKALKIIFNILIKGKLYIDFDISIYCTDKNGDWLDIFFNEKNGKKQYDGTYFFTVDIKNKDCKESIQISKLYGFDNIKINNLTVEFEESFLSFDYLEYKSALSYYIN